MTTIWGGNFGLEMGYEIVMRYMMKDVKKRGSENVTILMMSKAVLFLLFGYYSEGREGGYLSQPGSFLENVNTS